MVLLHALGEQAADWEPVRGRFAEHYRVVSVDLRGHGASPWPGRYSYRLMRDDVLALLTRLGLQEVVLVGHSLGGVVALMVAAHAPARVARLVVEDVVPPYVRDRPVPEAPDGPVDFDWAVVPAIVRETNAGDPAAWDALAAITAPTLLVAGGAESHVPQELIADAAARIPDCQLVTIPVGHSVHATRPAEFADTVLVWLGPATAY
jgi:pimeloyl-ACP methyl ester carboxylesterase